MDTKYIKGIVQKILNKEFKNSEKRRIDDYDNRLNFACCYCGDSAKNNHKKRANIWFNKLIYVCFNCDKKTSIERFFKDFNEIIDPDKKLEIIEHLNSSIEYDDINSDFIETDSSDLFNIKDIEDLFNNKKTTPIYDFKPIDPKGGIFKYLIGRGIPPNLHKNIYQAKFSKGDEGFEHIIIFLNRKDDKLIGMQVRNLREGKKRFFVIYNWEHIYRWLNGEDSEIDVHKSVLYNKMSYLFNILNIDFDETITIFEGFIDSLFYPNSIGVVGVNTDLKLLENKELDIQYFFDNDQAGFIKSEEKIKEGGKVFLWKKLLNDIVEKRKDEDPYATLNRISKVKDLNKLCEILPDAYKKLSLPNYFSKDIYDLRFIPKKEIVKSKSKIKDYQKQFDNL